MAKEGEKHYVGMVAQKAIIENDENKILIVLPTGISTWDLPGGRLNQDEVPKDALLREIQEELGISVEVGNAVFADMWGNDNPAKIRYFVAFACSLSDPNETFMLEASEISDIKWIGKDEFQSLPLFDICKRALEAYFNKR